MNDLINSNQNHDENRSLEFQNLSGKCRYCKAPLNREYYFCVFCGKPYKEMDKVVAPVAPFVPGFEEMVEQKVPQVKTLFWTYFIIVLVGGVLSFYIFEGSPQFQLILNTFLMMGATLVFYIKYRETLLVQFSKIGIFKKEFLYGLLLLIPLLFVNYQYHGWISRQVENSVDMIGEMKKSGLSMPSLIFFIALSPAIVEEIALRGLLQTWLMVVTKPRNALIIASALFAGLHFNPISFPYLFAVGMLLGWVKYKTHSLYPPIILHFLHNLSVLVILDKF
jgi:CAAX protease family protein